MKEKILQTCPKCSHKFQQQDYFANSVICSNCNSHFSAQITSPSFWARNHTKIMAIVLVLGSLQFSVLIYKNWDRIMKNDSKISSYIKHYWDDLKEDKLIKIARKCNLENDFQCQMLTYKKLNELKPNNEFYKKTYEAKLRRYNNPPKLKLPEDY